MRLGERHRRAGSATHPRSSSLSSSERAAMSLIWPVEVAPVPDLAQFAREPIPAPIGMGRQQAPHLLQLGRANGPPLHDQTVFHAPTLHGPPSRVQPKMKLFFAFFSLTPSPRAPHTACQLNEKT